MLRTLRILSVHPSSSPSSSSSCFASSSSFFFSPRSRAASISEAPPAGLGELVAPALPAPPPAPAPLPPAPPVLGLVPVAAVFLAFIMRPARPPPPPAPPLAVRRDLSFLRKSVLAEWTFMRVPSWSCARSAARFLALFVSAEARFMGLSSGFMPRLWVGSLGFDLGLGLGLDTGMGRTAAPAPAPAAVAAVAVVAPAPAVVLPPAPPVEGGVPKAAAATVGEAPNSDWLEEEDEKANGDPPALGMGLTRACTSEGDAVASLPPVRSCVPAGLLFLGERSGASSTRLEVVPSIAAAASWRSTARMLVCSPPNSAGASCPRAAAARALAAAEMSLFELRRLPGAEVLPEPAPAPPAPAPALPLLVSRAENLPEERAAVRERSEGCVDGWECSVSALRGVD